jgi:hypothetical protein
MINGNKVDLTNAPIYRNRRLVLAFDLPIDVTIYKDWGQQEMGPADKLIVYPGSRHGHQFAEVYGIKGETFLRTYQPAGAGFYRKVGHVRAVQMDEDFNVVHLDSDKPATGSAGDWLVENIRDDGVDDRYRIAADLFPTIYHQIG